MSSHTFARAVVAAAVSAVAAVSATAVSATAAGTAAGAAGDAAGGCEASYEQGVQYPDQFRAFVRIRNAGSADWAGWRVTWTYTSGERLAGPGFNASFAQTGTAVTVANLSWNANPRWPGALVTGVLVLGTAGAVPTITCTAL